MMLPVLQVANSVAVGLFGMVLSCAFCPVKWERRNVLIMAVCAFGIFLVQGLLLFCAPEEVNRLAYPLSTHLPLTLALCVLSRRKLWPFISVLTAYLCCQMRRWIALMAVAAFSGGEMLQYSVELAATLPLLLLLFRAAPSVQMVSQMSLISQIQFGVIPLLYYAFDFSTRVYTDLLSTGSPVVVEFMPFICSTAYLFFVSRLTREQRERARLEQVQSTLNLQVSQAVREIDSLRQSQQKTRAYRHDMRHHLQYLSACLENGQTVQAQEYIRSISDEIEAAKVTVYCENEAANLILSSFACRAETLEIPLHIRAVLPTQLPIGETELCVLLSNALENAIHACCETVNRGGEGIDVQAFEKEGKFFMQVVNDCRDTVRMENGLPVTSRPGHGMGVRSICAVVEKYGGIYSFSVQKEKFILRISL